MKGQTWSIDFAASALLFLVILLLVFFSWNWGDMFRQYQMTEAKKSWCWELSVVSTVTEAIYSATIGSVEPFQNRALLFPTLGVEIILGWWNCGSPSISVWLVTRLSTKIAPKSHGLRNSSRRNAMFVHFPHGGFLEWGYPQIIHLNRIFHYKPSIWGYPDFQKTPKWARFPMNWCPWTEAMASGDTEKEIRALPWASVECVAYDEAFNGPLTPCLGVDLSWKGIWWGGPSGKHTKKYGKSPALIVF